MQPRKLFADEQSPLGIGREQDLSEVYEEEGEQRKEEEEEMKRPTARKRETFVRPPALTLSSNQTMLPNLRYSKTSSSISPPLSPTPSSTSSSAATSTPNKESDQSTIKPSLALLFTLTTRPTFFTIVLPALTLSIAAGLIPPYMTQVLGETLQHFTDYTVATANPELPSDLLSSARSTLLKGVQIEAIKFACLGAAVLIISTANQALWVIHGERVARVLRLKVYEGLHAKGLDWFDKGMGGEKGEGENEASGDSAAGLMGRFTK